MWWRKQFGVQLPISIFNFSMWHSIIPLETTTSFTRHIIVCDAVAFPNQVVGGRESLLNKGNFFTQLEHAVDSALQLLSFSDILYFTGDGSGMSICNFSYCSLVGNWSKYKRTILAKRTIWAKCGTFYWCLGVDLFLHGNLLFIGHSSFIGGEFSAVFLLGRRLHVSAGGFASPSRASAFNCGSRPAWLVLHFWELSHCPHVADGECIFSVEPNIEAACYQWRLLPANWLREYCNFGSLQDYLRVGNHPLRRPFEVLVRFSLDVQPVRASRLREIFGPVATPMWKFSTNVGSLRRYCFPFFIYSWQYCGQSYLHGLWLSPLLHFHTTTGRTALQLTTLGVFMLHELPASRWSKPGTGLSRQYRRVPWTWRRFICRQQHFDVMAGASSLFSDQFMCHLGTSEVVEIFATSNCHGGSWLCHTWVSIRSYQQWEQLFETRSELLKWCAFGIILRRWKAQGGPRWDYCRSRPSSRASWMAARWNGAPWRFQSLSELINPTKTASFCPGETEHDGIPRYGPGRVYVNSSSPRQVVGPAKRLQCSWRGWCKVGLPQGGGNCRHPTSHWIQWCGGRIIIASGRSLGDRTQQTTNRVVQLPGEGRFLPELAYFSRHSYSS